MSSSQSTDPTPTPTDGEAPGAAEPPAEEPSTKKPAAKKPTRSSKKKSAAPPTDPFDRLEQQTRLAIEEIERLRRVNQELRSEVADLAAVARHTEEEPAQEEESEGASAEASAEAAAWETERGEIRERVEGLVSGLEQMLILVEEE